MSWADDIKRITDSGIADMGIFASKLKFETFTDVVKRTRVDTGRLRGNWQIADGSAPTGTVETQSSAPQGQVPQQQYSEIVKGSTEEGVTYFVNNLPYAGVYEEKDAMVGGAVAGLKARVRSIANQL